MAENKTFSFLLFNFQDQYPQNHQVPDDSIVTAVTDKHLQEHCELRAQKYPAEDMMVNRVFRDILTEITVTSQFRLISEAIDHSPPNVSML